MGGVMKEPGPTASDAELADYYDQNREMTPWGERQPADKPERLDVTMSVRFADAELAAIRARADAAGVKPTAYIRDCALTADQPPLDRARLSRSVAALSRDVDDLRRAAG